MLLIGDSLGADGTSNAVQTTSPGKVWLLLSGGFSSQTVTLQYSVDRGATYATLTVDGAEQTFTATTMEQYELPGGVWLRADVSDGGTPTIDVRIGGHNVKSSS